jgi:hypothetical protein
VLDDRFEADVRAALRLELAAAVPGVAAPQVRGRIAERARQRRQRRLALLAIAAAILVVVAIPVLRALVLTEPVAPPQGSAQPAAVVAMDPSRGDVILTWVSPDGQTKPAVRYEGALHLLRDATGDASLDRLPDGTVATAGADGRLAIALPDGTVLVARAPGRSLFVTRAADGLQSQAWLGWTDDGRLVTVANALTGPDARLRVRVVDPESGDSSTGTLPYEIVPLAPGQLLTWTADGMVLALSTDPTTFTSITGSLDVTAAEPSFSPGLPARLRVTTGLEPLLAGDGSRPAGWSEDVLPGYPSVGLAAPDEGTAPAAHWYAAGTGDRIYDVVRSAGLRDLVALVARTDASDGRIVVIDAPGSWREAVVLSGAASAATPGLGSTRTSFPRILGVAADGRSVAAWIAERLVVADLASGAWTEAPAAWVFVGWPTATTASIGAIPGLPGCEPPAADTVGSITLRAAGTTGPATSGARPVVGDPGDADPWRSGQLAAAETVDVAAGARLTLTLPAGACFEAGAVEALPLAGPPGTAPTSLGSWTAGHGTIAGLVDTAAPSSGGEWIVRAKLWLTGADREAILLYRVRTTGE